MIELQVFELLDCMLLPEEDVVSVLILERMQAAELQLLLSMLTHEAHLRAKLLQAAANHLIPRHVSNQGGFGSDFGFGPGFRLLPERKFILHVRPAEGRAQLFDIPGSDVVLQVQCKDVDGSKENRVYFAPPVGARLHDVWRFVEIFAIHTTPPYLRQHVKADTLIWNKQESGAPCGWPQYLDEMYEIAPAPASLLFGRPPAMHSLEGSRMWDVFFSIGMEWGTASASYMPDQRPVGLAHYLKLFKQKYHGPWRDPDTNTMISRPQCI